MKSLTLLFAAFLLPGLILPADSSRASDFYKEKTITLVHGSSPGGTHDTQAKIVVELLRKYIPGQPSLVSQYVPGAGGAKAANLVYSARPDGFTVGVTGSVVRGHVLEAAGGKFDPARFIYVGATDRDSSYRVLAVKKELGLGTVEKLRSTSGLRFSSQAVGHDTYMPARLFAYFLDLKEPRFVTGYSGPETEIAFLSGEVDARAIGVILLGRERYRPLIEEGKAAFVATVGRPDRAEERNTLVTGLPNLEEFGRTERDRGLLAIYRRVASAPRWVYFLPPGTPKQSTDILREAMRKVFDDPQFYVEYEKRMSLRPLPNSGHDVERATNELLALARDPEIVQLLRRINGPEPLPAR